MFSGRIFGKKNRFFFDESLQRVRAPSKVFIMVDYVTNGYPKLIFWKKYRNLISLTPLEPSSSEKKSEKKKQKS